MRLRYPYHYSPTKEELEKAGTTALFVFDTNTLLDILRLSPKLANKTIHVISNLQSRIMIPAHVDLEYHRRILETPAKMGNVVNQCIGNFDYKKIETTLKSFFNVPKDSLRFPKDCMDEYLNKFQTLAEEVLGELKELRTYYNDLYHHQSNQYHISNLLQAQVMKGFTEDELNVIKEEGLERYKKEIPPGYMDDSKDEDRKYGDLIIWKELLRLAENNKDKAIFFISNDKKEDWVYKKYDKIWGPRIELLQEFGKVSDQIFYIYTLDQFLKFFGQDTLTRKDIIDVYESFEKSSQTDEIKASDKVSSPTDIKYSKDQQESKKVTEDTLPKYESKKAEDNDGFLEKQTEEKQS